MIHTVTAFAFLRSQKPELKTDYRNFIESPDCPREVTDAFERVHEILHQRYPKRPVRLSFAVETAAGAYLCQCYCGEVRSPEGRPFLALCGIAARISELKYLEINPVALFFAADFTAIVADELAVIKRDVSAAPNFGVQANPQLRSEFAARLNGGLTGTVAWPATADLHTVLCSLFYAYQDLPPESWYDTAFALELPPDAALEIPFSVVMPPHGGAAERAMEAARAVAPAPVAAPLESPPPSTPPVSQARPVSPRTGRQRLLALEKLADALQQQRGADEFWRYRLWHYCQDVISAAELCLEADDNHQAGEAGRQLALVGTRRERLEQEITRAFATPDLRPVANDLKRDLREWFDSTFVPSLHVARDGKAPARASGDDGVGMIPRPGRGLSRLPPWGWALLALAFLAVVVSLLVKQGIGPIQTLPPSVRDRP